MAHSIRALVFPYLLLAGIATSAVQAQITNVTDDTSTPIPGAGHDYIHLLSETVNPANGSVSLRIQLPVAKGRGIEVPFYVGYDSNGVSHLSSPSPGQLSWASNNGRLSQGGGNIQPPWQAPALRSILVTHTTSLLPIAGSLRTSCLPIRPEGDML
jgi:hypothetical protein